MRCPRVTASRASEEPTVHPTKQLLQELLQELVCLRAACTSCLAVVCSRQAFSTLQPPNPARFLTVADSGSYARQRAPRSPGITDRTILICRRPLSACCRLSNTCLQMVPTSAGLVERQLARQGHSLQNFPTPSQCNHTSWVQGAG